MRIRTLACAAAVAAAPVSADDLGLIIDLLPGHPIYHERQQEAGVVMALSIAPGQSDAAGLKGLCEELRVAAGLERVKGDDLLLEVVFVVPYKGMAIEGYYWPADGTSGSEELVRGNSIARKTLDSIVGRAGIPSHVLDEPEVEQEISCEIDEPAWLLRWEDVRFVDGEEPDTVIARAHSRFVAIHESVVEHAMGTRQSADLQSLGSSRPAHSFAATKVAPAQATAPQPVHLKP